MGRWGMCDNPVMRRHSWSWSFPGHSLFSETRACISIDSVLPRPFFQGAAPCPFLVTPCLFQKAEMAPCLFCKKNCFFSLLVKKAGHHLVDDDDEIAPYQSWPRQLPP